MLSFNQLNYTIKENITSLSVGLMLNKKTSEDVTVEFTITDGSAKGRWFINCWCKVDKINYFTAGIDYDISSLLNNNVTITAGMTSSSFDVDIIDNDIQDGDKMFTITIRPLSTCFTLPVTVDSNTSVVTISNDEGIMWFINLLSSLQLWSFCLLWIPYLLTRN